MKNRFGQRCLSMLLAVLMLIPMLPVQALAEDAELVHIHTVETTTDVTVEEHDHDHDHAAEEPVVEEPVVEEPAVEEPVVEEPVVEEPVVEEPVVEEPVVEEPVVEEPVVEEPVVEEPVVDEPVVEEPVVDEPVVEEPVVEEPVVEEPVVDEPVVLPEVQYPIVNVTDEGTVIETEAAVVTLRVDENNAIAFLTATVNGEPVSEDVTALFIGKTTPVNAEEFTLDEAGIVQAIIDALNVMAEPEFING